MQSPLSLFPHTRNSLVQRRRPSKESEDSNLARNSDIVFSEEWTRGTPSPHSPPIAVAKERPVKGASTTGSGRKRGGKNTGRKMFWLNALVTAWCILSSVASYFVFSWSKKSLEVTRQVQVRPLESAVHHSVSETFGLLPHLDSTKKCDFWFFGSSHLRFTSWPRVQFSKSVGL